MRKDMYDFEKDALRETRDMHNRAGRNDSRHIHSERDSNESLERLAAQLNNYHPKGTDIAFGDTSGKKNVSSYYESGYNSMPAITSNGITFDSGYSGGIDVIGRRMAEMNREEEIDLEMGRMDRNPFNANPIKRLFSSKYEDELMDKPCPQCKNSMTAIGKSKDAVTFACSDCGLTMRRDVDTLRKEAEVEYNNSSSKFVRASSPEKKAEETKRKVESHHNAWGRWAQKQAEYLDTINVDPRELRREINCIQDWYDATDANIEDFDLGEALAQANAWERGS